MNPDNFYIILSHPFTADNIGSAARAIKNMGFKNLRLVAPRRNWRRRANVLACHATDVIKSAQLFSTLEESVADLNWTVGTTRRIGERRGKFIAFDRFIDTAQTKSNRLKIGIVFGCEAKGLNNHELDCCDQLVSIPADEGYPSMNLAQSVMVTVFSLARHSLRQKSRVGNFEDSGSEPLLDKIGVQSALQSFEEALECVGFYKGKDGRLDKIMKITAALFKRAGMHHYEAQMLKGISARIKEKAKTKE